MLFSIIEPRVQHLMGDARDEAVRVLGLWLHEDDCNVLREASRKLEGAVERLWDAVPPAEAKKTNLGRHIHFLGYWLDRQKKDACTSDVIDIALHDLPDLESALRERASQTWSLDAELRKKTLVLLDAGHGADAVRNAFIVLSERLRRVKRGLRQRDGHALVEELLGEQGRLVQYLTDEPRRGMRHLLLGLYAQFRNPHAHRTVEVTSSEAAGLVLVVDRVLKDLAAMKKFRRKRARVAGGQAKPRAAARGATP